MELLSNGKWVIFVVGVNGSGKTTTIGKLGYILKHMGKSVLFVAADTFRAAAIEQLEVWGERCGIPVVKHREGADPGAVAYDGIKSAQSRDIDIVIVDTAGRLHTKYNLMEELKKVKRVIEKERGDYKLYTLLVIDATMGQNAINQTRMFNEALGIDGIAVTKLDGTAKGGVIIGIASEFKIPVVLVGVGEDIEDMQGFNREEFVNALFWEMN
jgi:fused signal recognition particle receptor